MRSWDSFHSSHSTPHFSLFFSFCTSYFVSWISSSSSFLLVQWILHTLSKIYELFLSASSSPFLWNCSLFILMICVRMGWWESESRKKRAEKLIKSEVKIFSGLCASERTVEGGRSAAHILVPYHHHTHDCIVKKKKKLLCEQIWARERIRAQKKVGKFFNFPSSSRRKKKRN